MPRGSAGGETRRGIRATPLYFLLLTSHFTMPLVLLLVVPTLVAAMDTHAQGGPRPVEESVTVTADGSPVPVAGTLLVPGGDGPFPVVLVIAGSGPTDRNGNSPALPGANNAYKLLAEALAAQGVATLRYDKRGIGGSGRVDEASLRFDMLVDDAVAWVERLRSDRRFSRVIVAGHSEGSLIGMLAAARARADGFISIAGPARRGSDIIRTQLMPQIGGTPLWDGAQQILAALESGKTVDPLPEAMKPLAALFRPSVQPYLISWFRYEPATVLREFEMPVLILQGTTDIQVAVDEAKALHAARPAAELRIIEGMNHVLKEAPADRQQNLATYSNPDLPVVPDVTSAIVRFVMSR